MAHSLVQTLALALTVRSVMAALAFLVTVVATVAGRTVAEPGDGVAQLVGLGALAHLVTVEPIGTRQTCLLTAVASEPRGTAALAGHVVTGSAEGTGTALRTVLTEGSG